MLELMLWSQFLAMSNFCLMELSAATVSNVFAQKFGDFKKNKQQQKVQNVVNFEKSFHRNFLKIIASNPGRHFPSSPGWL
jgi:hypothetical protein